MTISLKADASGNFGSILINGTEAVRVNPGGIPASSTAFTPAGNIAATNVQTAIQELDTETQAGLATKVSKSGDTMTGALNVPYITANGSDTAAVFLSYNTTAVGSPLQMTIENNLSSSKIYAARGNLQLQAKGGSGIECIEPIYARKALTFINYSESYAPLIESQNANAGGVTQLSIVQNLGNIEIHNKRGPIYMQANSVGGVILNSAATAWAAWSDERMKTDFVSFDNALEKVCSLRAGTGRYLTDEEGASRSFLMAQDVQAVLPEAVDTGEDGMLLLRSTDLIPLLVAAVKELKAEVDELRAQLAFRP